MARAYSDDLRRKFLQAYEKKKGTLEQLAERFEVSVGWAKRWGGGGGGEKKFPPRRTRTGQIERPPWRRGPVSRVTVVVQDWMREQIRKQPDLTLMELQEQLQGPPRVPLS